MSDDRNYYGSAWAYVGPNGVSSKTLFQRLQKALENATRSSPTPVGVVGADTFWRQGLRVAESIRWECEKEPLPMRTTSTRTVGHWALGQESGLLEPVSAGFPWPSVSFSGMVSSSKISKLVTGPASSAVALGRWTEELSAIDSSPPWVYWALQGDGPQLERELGQICWDKQAISQWWKLMSSLIEVRPCAPRHYELGLGENGLEVKELPITSWSTRQDMIKLLCECLPAHARSPVRLSNLDNAGPLMTGSPDAQVIDEVLRGWVSPARFWSLRKVLYVPALTKGFDANTLNDFRALPKASAYRALEKMASGPMTFFNAEPLEALPLLHDHVPDWPGWRDLLSRLEPSDLLPPQSLAFLASLKEVALDQQLPGAVQQSRTPMRARF